MKFSKSLLQLFLVVVTGLALSSAQAETRASDEPNTAILPSSDESVFQKYFRDMYAPFVDSTTLSIFAGGTLATATLLATHADFEDRVLENASTQKPLGGTSAFGDYAGQLLPNILYVGYHGIAYLISKDPRSEMRAEMMLRSTLSATTMSTILKVAVREPRPSSSEDLSSFPSGHATSIFAFATTFAALHGVYWGAGAYGLASFVAFSRMNDNRHRLHDVVAGATIGSMYGLAVYHRMREENAPSIKTAGGFQYEITPVVLNDGGLLSFSGSF